MEYRVRLTDQPSRHPTGVMKINCEGVVMEITRKWKPLEKKTKTILEWEKKFWIRVEEVKVKEDVEVETDEELEGESIEVEVDTDPEEDVEVKPEPKKIPKKKKRKR